MKYKKSNTYSVQYRRKRQGKTDYRKRLTLLKSGKARLVIRKSLRNITAQIIRFDPKGDVIIASATSNSLKEYGLNTEGSNIPAAYLVGLLIGKRALEKGVKEAIGDIGPNQSAKGSKIYAVIKGAIDAGLSVPASEDVLPVKDKIEGKSIESYAKMLDEKKISGPFSEYRKKGIKTSEISKYFDNIKKKIMGGA